MLDINRPNSPMRRGSSRAHGAVMDRAEGYSNHGGPLGADVMAALFRARSAALAANIIYGLGGRDVRVEDMEQVFEDLQTMIDQNDAGETYRYMGLRE